MVVLDFFNAEEGIAPASPSLPKREAGAHGARARLHRSSRKLCKPSEDTTGRPFRRSPPFMAATDRKLA